MHWPATFLKYYLTYCLTFSWWHFKQSELLNKTYCQHSTEICDTATLITSVPSLDQLGRPENMADDSAEILFLSSLQKAMLNCSGLGRYVNFLFIQHFLCWPWCCPLSKVPWRRVLERLSWHVTCPNQWLHHHHAIPPSPPHHPKQYSPSSFGKVNFASHSSQCNAASGLMDILKWCLQVGQGI